MMSLSVIIKPGACGIEGEDDSYDFGTGAGFYIDATEDKWKTNYRMYSYITKELPSLIQSNFPILPDKQSVFGHSMGGHGALICFLKNPGFYKSVSAFAPICNPMQGQWGQKAFTGYIGSNKEAWKEYDATELVKKYQGPPPDILIDQGLGDEFYPSQLLPETLLKLAGVKCPLPGCTSMELINRSDCFDSHIVDKDLVNMYGGVAYDHESMPKVVAVHTLTPVRQTDNHGRGQHLPRMDRMPRKCPHLLVRNNSLKVSHGVRTQQPQGPATSSYRVVKWLSPYYRTLKQHRIDSAMECNSSHDRTLQEKEPESTLQIRGLLLTGHKKGESSEADTEAFSVAEKFHFLVILMLNLLPFLRRARVEVEA
ncbi:hypothetical protein OS493_022911 [Desmophyllum pertusum]|uniref:S-formylglutathione hydrolase n=1 Tax=Desmophyllum pertusum TaxID=174260 RepID=A0A9W9ZM88_9CNID|nr:hypothetical protein OS493_022911 [Desmophyllum pertusum]